MTEYTYMWAYIEEHPQETKRLLGLDHQQLLELIAYGKLLKENKNKEIEKSKTRLIKEGGGNKAKLSEEEQIILMLVYLRHYLSFQLLGIMFKISESSAHNIFNYWQSLFEGNLPASLFDQLKKYPEEMEKVKEELIQHELIVDATEQPVERPLGQEEQKPYYSGKKKRHTSKSQIVICSEIKDIVDVVIGEIGSKSDVKIFRESLHKFHQEQGFLGDKAYVGEFQVTTPKKKPKKGELTKEEKERNSWLSSRRIMVEHMIRLLKIFKVMQERFRLRKERYKSIVSTVCGLVRLRINALILSIIKCSESGQAIEARMSHCFLPELNFDT